MKARDALDLLRQKRPELENLVESKEADAELDVTFFNELKAKEEHSLLDPKDYARLVCLLMRPHDEKSFEVQNANSALFNDLLSKAKEYYSQPAYNYSAVLDCVFLELLRNKNTPQYHYLLVALLAYEPPFDKDGYDTMMYRIAKWGTPQIAGLAIDYLKQRNRNEGFVFEEDLLRAAEKGKNWRMIFYFFNLIEIDRTINVFPYVDAFIENAPECKNEASLMVKKLEESVTRDSSESAAFFFRLCAGGTVYAHVLRVFVENADLSGGEFIQAATRGIKPIAEGGWMVGNSGLEKFDCAYALLRESDRRKALKLLLMDLLNEFITSAPLRRLIMEWVVGLESIVEEAMMTGAIRHGVQNVTLGMIDRFDFDQLVAGRPLDWCLFLLNEIHKCQRTCNTQHLTILLNRINICVGAHAKNQQFDQVLPLFEPVQLAKRIGARWLDVSIKDLVDIFCQHFENSNMRFDQVARRIVEEVKFETPFSIRDIDKNKVYVAWMERYNMMMRLASCASLHKPWPQHCNELFEDELKGRISVFSPSQRARDKVDNLREAGSVLGAIWTKPSEERKASAAAVSVAENKSLIAMSTFSDIPDTFSIMWRYLKRQNAPLLLALFVDVIKAIKENKAAHIISAIQLIFTAFEHAPEFKEQEVRNRFLNFIGVVQGEPESVISDCALRQGEVIFNLRRQFMEFEKRFLNKNPEEKARLEEMLRKKAVVPAVVPRSAGPGSAAARS